MSGIAGILSLGRPANLGAVQAMTGSMPHRGPDGDGLWQSPDGLVALGCRQMAPVHSPQPFADDALVLCLDGEIYNHPEIRAELQARGHVFATLDQTEVVARAWRQWGEAAVEFFNGAFALVLWDNRRRLLFCARDRFGEKPLLYTQGDGWFAFASEYRALLGLEGVEDAIDQRRLGRFLAHAGESLEANGQTLFTAIRQLPPAHAMLVESETPRLWRYWEPKPARMGRRLSMAAAATAFHDLLADSVRLRLRGDDSVGLCLSGGVDSSAVACLASRTLGERPRHTFSIRFPGTSADEGPHIEAVAAVIQPRRHEVEPKPRTLLAELDAFAWANEVPADSASQYARYCLFRLAREQGITTLLDGLGADVMTAGHPGYFAAYLRGGGEDSPLLHSRYGDILATKSSLGTRLPRWWRRLRRDDDIVLGLCDDPGDARPAPPADLHQALKADATDGWLAGMLRQADRNAMAHSIVLRLPFTDYRLLELVLALPADYLMGEGETKRLLRAAMAGVLPDMVRLRWRKHGFVPPQIAWLHQGLLPAVEAMIEDGGLSPLWYRPWWRQAVRRFRAGQTSLAPALWKVLATESWRRAFVDRVAGQAKARPLA